MRSRLNPSLVFYAVVGAGIVFLPLVLYGGAGAILCLFVTPILGLVLLFSVIFAKGRRLLFLLMLVVYCAASVVLATNFRGVRSTVRWFLWSKSFKAEVLSQPDRSDKGWKHIEWDGWGFAGAGNTVVYLVYNPSNSLAEAARTHSSGVVLTPDARVVPRVQRLENSWYSVVFYTQTDWDHGE